MCIMYIVLGAIACLCLSVICAIPAIVLGSIAKCETDAQKARVLSWIGTGLGVFGILTWICWVVPLIVVLTTVLIPTPTATTSLILTTATTTRCTNTVYCQTTVLIYPNCLNFKMQVTALHYMYCTSKVPAIAVLTAYSAVLCINHIQYYA